MVYEGTSRNRLGETGFDLQRAAAILFSVDWVSSHICMLAPSLSFGDVDCRVDHLGSPSVGSYPAVMVRCLF
jgi:hypothetical protein